MKLQSVNLQRVGFLALLPGFLRSHNVNPAEVLAAVGLAENAINNPEATIPYQTMGALVQRAAEVSGQPGIGLAIGRQIRTPMLGLVGDLIRNAPTLGDALRDFAVHHHRNSHGGVVYLLTDGHLAYFGYAVYQEGVPGSPLIADGAAMAACGLVEELASPGAAPISEVWLSRPEPADPAPYRKAFGVPLRFDAEQTAVVMPRSALMRPLASADAEIRKAVGSRLNSLLHVGPQDIVTRLRRELRVALLSGAFSAEGVCSSLGMSRRTLDRRLRDEGLRYQEILDQTRCEYARQLLSDTSMGAGQIALVVGYADASVFTRAFTRWMGQTPGDWRAELRV